MKPVYIIAEAGVNHNGKLKLAKQLIAVAAAAGADAVKFQTFRAKELTTANAPKARYQQKHTGRQFSQQQMLQKLELSFSEHQQLIKYCKQKKIDFLSSPFDLESVDLLAKKMRLKTIKIPSGEITNAPLLLKVAQAGCRVILSTGLSDLSDVEWALSVLAYGYLYRSVPNHLRDCKKIYKSSRGRQALRKQVTLLHCTSEYPAPFSDVNLRAMATLRKTFQLKVGLSDHTEGFAIPLAAVANGACVIEKHFTLSHNLPGPDHQASLEPDDLIEMIRHIREVEQAIGDGIKKPRKSELKNKHFVRKVLVAAGEIRKGELFTKDNLTLKRTGRSGGISGMQYFDYLNKKAEKNYQSEEMVK